ncbi:hypothetical protein JB92DRAFT_3106331 [Gautieria morchelliformis]|nr:hypothetical protein JB92DRAFT_3106331 [Gautieria morchelliformis]
MPSLDCDRGAIFRVVAYHCRDYDASVLSTLMDTNREPSTRLMDHGRSTLGDLEVLAVELLNEILKYAHLSSVLTFRLLSKRARAVVDASVPYKHILLNAPCIISALVRTGVSSHFTVDEIFRSFTTPNCQVCGMFGAFLWIPECIRCCIPCLRESPELLPMTECDAKAAFGLTKRTLADVPVMISLPGTYTLSKTPQKRARRLLSQKRARLAAVAAHGGEKSFMDWINSGISQSKAAHEQRLAARNRAHAGCDSQGNINCSIDDVKRFMATTHLPYFDITTRTTQNGLSCRGCQLALDAASSQTLSLIQSYVFLNRRDRTYTEDGLLEHVKECVEAQSIWASPSERIVELLALNFTLTLGAVSTKTYIALGSARNMYKRHIHPTFITLSYTFTIKGI